MSLDVNALKKRDQKIFLAVVRDGQTHLEASQWAGISYSGVRHVVERYRRESMRPTQRNKVQYYVNLREDVGFTGGHSQYRVFTGNPERGEIVQAISELLSWRDAYALAVQRNTQALKVKSHPTMRFADEQFRLP